MPTNSLTDARCKGAKPADKAYKLFDGHGLYLWVSASGAKVWRVAYRAAGKPQTAVLGAYPLIGLAEARNRRDELRKRLLDGLPAKAPRVRAVPTVEAACEAYWETRKDVTAAYRGEAVAGLRRHVYPALGSLLVSQVTRAQVLDALLVMDAAGLAEFTRKVLRWLGMVFDRMVELEHVQANVCKTIRPRMVFQRQTVEHFAAIELHEVPEFIKRLNDKMALQSALALRFTALTWLRPNECRYMKWSEIRGNELHIAGARMKRSNDHIVPLTQAALDILDAMRPRCRNSAYVFPSDWRIDRPMSENAMLYLIYDMGYKGRMTVHGWRAVASTWANDRGFNEDWIERQLAHVPDDKVRAAYNRAKYLPQRRQMLEAWAQWLLGSRD